MLLFEKRQKQKKKKKETCPMLVVINGFKESVESRYERVVG